MKITVIYQPSEMPLGTQNGIDYTIYPERMPSPDFTEKH